MSEIKGDALRGHLQTLILSSLKHSPAHGFQILQRLEQAGSGALKLKEGSLYPALYRLEADKLITGQWEDSASPRRGPRRRIYRLTPKGRRHFKLAAGDFHHFVSVLTKIVGTPT
jgi:PadR family transcriptional regulator PadR